MTELLNYSSVTAEKPSQFLLTLRTKLAKSDMPQEMIRELFIAKTFFFLSYPREPS